MSSSTKTDNRKKDILILGKSPTQGLHFNGANSYLSVNGKDIHKFKTKDSENVATPLCLGNISEDWTVDNMKKNWIKWLCL